MAAGDDRLGGQDLAVSKGEATTFRFVRSGGFTGTWTAVAGGTLGYDLTVADDGADKLVTIPAANDALIGKPWRLRRNGVSKVGGTVTLLRPTDTAGDGTVTFTDADAVTITCSVVADGAGVSVSDATPQALGVAAAGVSADASRADHVHTLPTIPALSDATPAAPGTAAAGVAATASRADHVHPHAYGSIVVPLFVPSSSNGTWAPAGALDYIQNGSAADGHWVEWLNVPLGGTYTVGCAVQQTNGSGKFQVSIDGSNVGSLLDAYAASNTATVLTSTGIVITPGLHTVRVTLNGKNASSSGYLLRLSSVAFTRTA